MGGFLPCGRLNSCVLSNLGIWTSVSIKNSEVVFPLMMVSAEAKKKRLWPS